MAAKKPNVGKRLAIAGVLIAAIVGGVLYFRSAEYQTVLAEVVSAEETCHFRTFSGRRRNRRHTDSAPLPCDQARQKEAAGQSGDATLQEITLLHIRYRSPADGVEYQSELRAWRNAYPGVQAGDRIEIQSHKTVPGDIKPAGRW